MPTEQRLQPHHSMEDGGTGQSKRSRFPPFAAKRSKGKFDEEKKRQVQDYIAWVNNYLKKRPHTTLVTDLRSGMQDGITLINLVEIAANCEIPFVDRNPLSASSRRSNIEKAIAFLNSDGANLGSDSTKDIIDGNIKGVMRVILAIAEKYNPRSVRPITANTKLQHPSTSSSSSSAFSQDQHRHHRDQSSPGRSTDSQQHSPRASSPLANYMLQQGNSLSQGVALSQGCNPLQSYGISPPQGISLSQGGGFSLSQPTPADGIYSTPIDSLPHHVTQQITSQMPRHRVIGPRPIRQSNNRTNEVKGKPPVPTVTVRVEDENKDPKLQQRVEEPTTTKEKTPPQDAVPNEIGGIISQLGEFKTELLQLHAVLLDNMSGDGDEKETFDIKVPLELASSQLTEKDKELEQLREKIKKLEEQCKKADTECETLRGMVMERNQFITSMKSEIYRKEYRNDTERVDLQTQLLHKDKMVKVLEAEVSLLKASVEGKDREVTDMREKIRQHESMEVELREELDRLTSAEESLHVKLTSRDKKIASLEEKVEEGRRFDLMSIASEETESIRRKLEALKSSVDQSQQGLLESLEKSISELYTRMSSDHSRSYSPGRRPRRHAYHDERREEKRRRHKERPSKEEVYHTVNNPTEWTKVFYYMTGDKTETPYVTTVPRKSHEVRLKDFKAVFDRQGSYRYYFKTQDPDCGVVREEIISEDQILPDWNGKIMVWVSEKAHHR